MSVVVSQLFVFEVYMISTTTTPSPPLPSPRPLPFWCVLGLHWDMNPWTGKCSYYGYDDATATLNTGYRLNVQGILALVDRAEADGGFHAHGRSPIPCERAVC